jgi:hypothetical protein
LAPYFFILVGDVLNYMVKETRGLGGIKGIFLLRGTKQHILTYYIDDIVLLVRGDEENLCNVVNLLQLFLLISRLEIN